MVYYKIKFKPKKTVITGSKYKYKRFKKGRVYEVRRKLSKLDRKYLRRHPTYKILSIKKLVRKN